MAHVIVKPWPGKSEQQKRCLADAITKDFMTVLQYGEESVSVAFEEVAARDWTEQVYKPDVEAKWDQVYKSRDISRFEYRAIAGAFVSLVREGAPAAVLARQRTATQHLSRGRIQQSAGNACHRRGGKVFRPY